ncbi:glycosyltransferase [Hahella aquimaris]|uniref:glycosyltransferase n=1 Tax=Hahella sp. HNIBRBA332 TaxID=3015983 RepID=UPI00273BD053|nr:glycosyltransferase [Hahella sp. HNIBRBA332]WLQ16364.1 glycosyltransferase [Hahella sp. HNIBRBA332]
MIFATVGTQLAFDRMISALDDWAGRNQDVVVYAQTGPAEYMPQHMGFADFLAPGKVTDYMREAELIVSHAGMGSIITAMYLRKPVIIMPRKASLGEHRNEHQLATAKWLANRKGIIVAWEAADLPRILDRRAQLESGPAISEVADGALVKKLSRYIQSLQ